MAKESTNVIKIAGQIVEIDSRQGVNKKGGYIAGKILVKTAEDNIVPVGFYANLKKNDGNTNPIAISLQSIVETYKTINEHGPDEADHVEITSAQISENTFYREDGREIRGFQLKSAFFNRKPSVEPESKFVVSGEVLRVMDEIVDDVPTGRAILTLLVIGYGNRANVIDFVVEGATKVDYVKATYSEGQEVKIEGNVVVQEIVQELKEEVAFGDPIVRTRTSSLYELQVTGGTAPQDSSIPEAEKVEMMSVRKAKLEEAKAAKMNKGKGSSKPKASNSFQL